MNKFFSVLVFSMLVLPMAFADTNSERCKSGEWEVLHCINRNAGWGLDNLTVDVCVNLANNRYSMKITRVGKGYKTENRVSAKRKRSGSDELILVSTIYNHIHTLTYSDQTRQAYYVHDFNGTLDATLNCR